MRQYKGFRAYWFFLNSVLNQLIVKIFIFKSPPKKGVQKGDCGILYKVL